MTTRELVGNATMLAHTFMADAADEFETVDDLIEHVEIAIEDAAPYQCFRMRDCGGIVAEVVQDVWRGCHARAA